MDEREKVKNLIKEISNRGLLYFFLASAVSADTLLSNEACEKSKDMLQTVLDVVPELDFSDEEKEKIKDYCTKGIEICDNEIENFKD